MPSIYSCMVDFIKEVKNEKNVYLTKKEYILNDCGRSGKMTLKWWKEKSILIISDIFLDTPNGPNRQNRNLLTETITKILSRENEALDPDRLVIQSVVLEGVYQEEFKKKMRDKGWSEDSSYTLHFY